MFLTQPDSLPTRPRRIISLVPSQTEMLHSLGLEEETIAITKFCVHPPGWFSSKIRIGGTKALDIDKIKELNPDLVIANYEENAKDQVEAIAADFPVWVTDVKTIRDALGMIRDIGKLTDKQSAAGELIRDIETSISRWQVVPRAKKSVKAAYLIWKDPYMTVGGDTFIHNMMNLAGFQNAFGWQERYPEVTADDIRESGCEVLLLSSEPYPFQEKHVIELSAELPGVTVVTVDGEMFSWYGSRIKEAPSYFHKMWQEIESFVPGALIPDPSLFLQKLKK